MANLHYEKRGDAHCLSVRVGGKVIAHGACIGKGNIPIVKARVLGRLAAYREAQKALRRVGQVNRGEDSDNE